MTDNRQGIVTLSVMLLGALMPVSSLAMAVLMATGGMRGLLRALRQQRPGATMAG